MKYLLLGLLFAFSSAVFADPAADRKALREANVKFSASFEACEDLAKGERKKCRSIAKREHTKAVERIDQMRSKP